MSALRQLLAAALCAGILAGILAAAMHQLGTVPLILEAETYERAAAQAQPAVSQPAVSQPAVSQPAAPDSHGAGEHRHAAGEPWEPETGLERAAYTLAADVLAGIGFALLLAAGIAVRGHGVSWRDGLFWGLAGFVVFALAPGLGLPPEIPGAVAAPLTDRQLWWTATAGLPAGGLALLAFSRRPAYAALGIALLVLPQVYGAPQPPDDASAAAPASLARQFAVAATVTSLVFWAALGVMTGYCYRRFGRRADAPMPSGAGVPLPGRQ
jgi:cobalt transporter subunit CbtA